MIVSEQDVYLQVSIQFLFKGKYLYFALKLYLLDACTPLYVDYKALGIIIILQWDLLMIYDFYDKFNEINV